MPVSTKHDPSIYHSDNFVTLDFEVDTSHGDFGHAVHGDNQMLLVCWKVGGEDSAPVVSKWGDEFAHEGLLKAIEAADFIVAHNAKYELGWLRRMGLDLGNPNLKVFDTKIAEYVLFGNLAAGCNATGLPPRSTSLDACCRRRGWKIKDPAVDIMMHAGINPVEMPRPWLEGRCKQDVETTLALFKDQLAALENTGRLPVLYTRCHLTPVLADMEFQGMYLDAERVSKEYRKFAKRLSELEDELNLFSSGINWNSPVQVAEFLYSPEPEGLGFDERRNRAGEPIRTSSGRPKADKATLAALKGKTKKQKKFLTLRSEMSKVKAALSKSLEFFVGICEEYDSLFYAQLHQTTTATHRLSSTGIPTFIKKFDGKKSSQFQNMARIFKSLFRSRNESWSMVEIDGSQIEFRVAAQLGGPDPQALSDITDPLFDAHCTSASIMNDIPYEDFIAIYRDESHPEHKAYKAMRTAAKVDTFKPLYGGESGTKKQKKWYKEFKARYAGIADTQEAWVEAVLYKKKLITPWGMRYYWPRAKRGHDGYCNVKSSVYNYPIQALATAEIVPIAVRSFWDRTRELRESARIRVVNTVHDSVILEAHPDAVEQVRECGILAFGMDVYDYLLEVYGMEFQVPLGCGITVGTHWSEGAEESFNIWPDGKVERV